MKHINVLLSSRYDENEHLSKMLKTGVPGRREAIGLYPLLNRET